MSRPRQSGWLRVALTKPPTSPHVDVPPPIKKRGTASEAVRACRERMKTERPDDYKRYRDNDKAYCRNYRKNLNEDQKQHQRETARLRMQKMRAKKKEAERNGLTQPIVLTRAVQDQKRKYWREQKQKVDEKLTPQGRRRKNEKRREKYREKMSVARQETFIATNTNQGGGDDPRTPAAQRKAVSRAKAALPKSPRRFVSTDRSN